MSGYGFAIPGANTRITETGAVKLPFLRHTPQVRVSSFSFSTSDIVFTRPLRPVAPSKKTITTGRNRCRKSNAHPSQEACPEGKSPCASAPAGLWFRGKCVRRSMTSSMARVLEKPELLAPAGDEESLRAAVAAGADAVYFGLRGGFNARARADNFGASDLPRIFDFLHSRGVQGFVTFNTLIFDRELPVAEEALADIARAGADAIIVQDLGAARLARAV